MTNEIAPAGKFNIEDLDDFVNRIDELGGTQSPNMMHYLREFSVNVENDVNLDLDPFSEEYVSNNIKFYEKVANRKLNQEEGEQYDFPLEEHKEHANPYAQVNPVFIAKHARCILNCILAAQCDHSTRILDIGAGWGLSTEMLGFTGLQVDFFDINPKFVELVKHRTNQRGIAGKGYVSSFDDFTTTEKYDMILFYECLHHSVNPYKTIEKVSRFLKSENSVIVLAGEPFIPSEVLPDISYKFKHWGLRTDSMSTYCIRKYGWFENGFTVEYMRELFNKIDFNLTELPSIGIEKSSIFVARHKSNQSEIPFDLFYPPSAQTVPPSIQTIMRGSISALLKRVFPRKG